MKVDFLTKNGVSSFSEFIKDLVDTHKGQDYKYSIPMITIMKDFQEKGPRINLDHSKKFPPFRRIEGDRYKDIYELRTKECRFFLYKHNPDHYIGLHGYEKQGNITPKPELEKARKEKLSWQEEQKKKLMN